jgi:two-component system, NarL family, sensor kinase
MTATTQVLNHAMIPSGHWHEVEIERQRIARDLHDSVGSMLATALLLLDGVEAQHTERFQKVKTILQDTQREVRRIAHGMSPAALTKLGLVPALEQLCDEINAANEVFIEFTVFVPAFIKRIDKALQVNVYRMIQELLQNALKHAAANHIELILHHNDTHLVVLYEDNGIGNKTLNYDVKAMRSLRERIKLMEGKIRVKSLENQGTIIKIEVPFS